MGLCLQGRVWLCLFCRFQRTVLDLSLQWRFANLPNNAKLEMVPVSRSREGPENMVGVQLGNTVVLLLCLCWDCRAWGGTAVR